MEKLEQTKLWTLERYAAERAAFRKQVIAHKQRRRLPLNAHATLHFEDFLTMKYQVQEMLRVERIFEADEIQAELDAYNPLIPDGDNWKATLMVEYPDVAERRRALQRLTNMERQVWTRVGEGPKIFAVANEDLERSNEEKTAAVHFLRFQLTRACIDGLRQSEPLRFGIDHERMRCEVEAPSKVRQALAADLD